MKTKNKKRERGKGAKENRVKGTWRRSRWEMEKTKVAMDKAKRLKTSDKGARDHR